MKLFTTLLLAAGSLSAATEGFDHLKAGTDVAELKSEFGKWSAPADTARIIAGHGKSGGQSLHILGGDGKVLELELSSALKQGGILSFWSERWTRTAPFDFIVEVKKNGRWEKKEDLSKVVKLGGFHTHTEVELEAGTQAIRWLASTPDNSGVMIDDLVIEPVKNMIVSGIETSQPVVPALIRKEVNPVTRFTIKADGSLNPKKLEAIEISLAGTDNLKDIESVSILAAGPKDTPGAGELIATTKQVSERLSFKAESLLKRGANHFWVAVKLKDSADIDGHVDAGIERVKLSDGAIIQPEVSNPEGVQRIGIAIRQHGDDKSKAYRIPGLATTNKGTLIGVYDVRWDGGHDLPGNIDVGMSRSTDGGQTWEKMKVIMDMGDNPKWRHDGIGDPAILVDKTNNRIWVAAVWSHGNRAWHGSGKGMKPEETGQFMLVHSDDDGKTWSKPINITEQVKDPGWHYMLQGPGSGITMKDGTLVFAAQYQDETNRRMPFSTIIYSKDQGKTWQAGTGIKSNTTEAQVVELADGSLMLNCRDNRGGSRTIGISYDLGKTWELHPTDRKDLNEPVCMASLIRFDREGKSDLLLFSNPNTTSGRYNMTIKVSDDEGLSWPEKWHTLYDSRSCSGYSSLTRIGDDKVGVFYEGPNEIFFLRFTLEELLNSNK